jgi:CheY-like chemotaxis protein
MTGIRYRCELSPSADSNVGRAPVWTEVSRKGTAPTSAALSVVRTMTRPEQGPSRAMAPPRAAAPAGTPDSAPASSSTRTETSSSTRSERILDGLRILIVEDDDDAREMVSIIFCNAGATVECAASAADGFDAVYNSHPQLLVSDIGMPDEDGYSLMRRIRALQSREGGDILAIALSAFTRPEDRMLALRAGFTIHIAKPVAPTELVATAARVAALMGHGGHRSAR